MNFDDQTLARAQRLATEGSPTLLAAVGRLVGLSGPEREQLALGKVPVWVWTVGGVAVGTLVGIQLQKRFPEQMGVLGGGR